MLLVIHAGLHKTASTYLQHVLMVNRGALHAKNIYFEPEREMNANHSTAWAALEDNFVGIREHLRFATTRRCPTAILTSEDFETFLVEPRRAQALEAAARQSGATQIEWHVCLRDPGDYFASLYAELSRHVFVDYLGTFAAVLRDGRLHVENTGRFPAYWEHVFDYETVLTAFAKTVGGKVVVHDFRDKQPYPGHAILERLTGGAPLANLPGPESRYERLPADQVEARFADKLDAIMNLSSVPPYVRDILRKNLHMSADVQNECRAAITRRFAPGMERLLAKGTLN